MISRAKLRGKPLDADCKKAMRTSHEYGPHDNRVFCYGLTKEMSNWEIQQKCRECGAYYVNAEPPASEVKENG